MPRPMMLLPSANSTQAPAPVLLLFSVPDCRKHYFLNVSLITNTIARAKAALPPTLTAYNTATLPMSVLCLYNPQPPYDGVASVEVDFTGADLGDYLLEIYDDDDDIFFGGVITID